MSSREERIAENETVFRDANEQLRERFGELEIERPQEVVFICECGDRSCTQLARLSLAEYEAVREDANTFLVVPGHDDANTEKIVTAEVVEENDRFAVVRKRPPFREAPETTDPR